MDIPPEKPQDIETDDRFPSGPWIGIYQQSGTQSRQRLSLTFRNGAVTGTGRDPAGLFDVRGSYDTATGKCSLVKIYPTHRVEYDGQSDGDGIEGNWLIRYYMDLADRGRFHIWPDAAGLSEGQKLEVEEPVAATSEI